jgi:hypothetical protein
MMPSLTTPLPPRRGASLAAELDRRLAGDELLSDIVLWWSEAWRTAVSLSAVSSPHGGESIRPENFSESFSKNEFTCYIISTISDFAYSDDDDDADDRIVKLQPFWSMVGLDGAKMADSAYVQQVMQIYMRLLMVARLRFRLRARGFNPKLIEARLNSLLHSRMVGSSHNRHLN